MGKRTDSSALTVSILLDDSHLGICKQATPHWSERPSPLHESAATYLGQLVRALLGVLTFKAVVADPAKHAQTQ